MVGGNQNGDWIQNLDRQGNPIEPVIKGLQVKDPFHLPRSLLYSLNAMDSLAKKGLPCPDGLRRP